MGNSSQLVTILPTAIAGLGGMLLALLPRGPERRPAVLAGVVLFLACVAAFSGEWAYTGYVQNGGVVPRALLGAGFLSDPVTWFFTILVLFGTLITVMMSFGQLERLGIVAAPEFYGLLLMTSASAIVLVGAGEMVTLFVGLEALSMGLYCLCGSASGSRKSVEGALKYFILGSFSSAFLLYGMAVLYGTVGSTELAQIAQVLPNSGQSLAAIGIGLVLVGLFFKLGAVPFHFWAPDVYQGAPTPVTAYMASVVKAAALAMAIRFLWTAFGDSVVVSWWVGFAWTVAVLTMIVGNVIAVRQRNVKRMLAYSSIAHVGYLSAALLTSAEQYGGGAALLFYIVIYSIVTFGAFAVTMVVTGERVDTPAADDISMFSGLAQRHPLLAAAMTLFLLTLAGLPPGVIGLVGKFYLLSAVVKAHYVGLAIIAGLCSAISCYYYLRVVMAMYVKEPSEETPEASMTTPPAVRLVIIGMAVISLVLGVVPAPLYNRAQVMMTSVFRSR